MVSAYILLFSNVFLLLHFCSSNFTIVEYFCISTTHSPCVMTVTFELDLREFPHAHITFAFPRIALQFDVLRERIYIHFAPLTLFLKL